MHLPLLAKAAIVLIGVPFLLWQVRKPSRWAVSRRENARRIAGGRVAIERASVSKLPFPDDRFDLVTAVETQYYWPDLPGDMTEPA